MSYLEQLCLFFSGMRVTIETGVGRGNGTQNRLVTPPCEKWKGNVIKVIFEASCGSDS
jgi:hypothetical protein